MADYGGLPPACLVRGRPRVLPLSLHTAKTSLLRVRMEASHIGGRASVITSERSGPLGECSGMFPGR